MFDVSIEEEVMEYGVVFEISKSGLGISTFALPELLFIAIGIVREHLLNWTAFHYMNCNRLR